jgi:ABC-type transport system involved in multi-copper enzyme maturation permease subunit
MILRMIYREILENLLSLRFVLSLLLAVSLFAAAGFVFVAKYQQESKDYWKDTNENLLGLSEKTKHLYDVALYEQKIYRKPKPLAFCAEGFEKYFPNRFRFNIFSMELPEVKSREHVDPGSFSDIDLAFIISVILSFVALVFTYNTICGEKEAGTLRLILASSVPRRDILIGKYIGSMLTLGIPLLLGLFIGLLIVTSSRDVTLRSGDWVKIIVIVLLSFLYLSIFVLLGMLVSSRTAHSANSMVILLLVWVGLVILIPSSGRIISDAAFKSPTQAELQSKLADVIQQILDDAASGKFGENPSYFGTKELENPKGTAQMVNARIEAENRVREDHLNRMMNPFIFGRSFTRLSPIVSYQCASEAIAGTGMSRFRNQYQQVKRYQQELKEFVRDKDAEDPESLHLLCSKGQAIKKWGVISKKAVDFDTVPKFQERSLAIGRSLKLALWDIGLLVLFNLAFFVVSFVSFLRYDPR